MKSDPQLGHKTTSFETGAMEHQHSGSLSSLSSYQIQQLAILNQSDPHTLSADPGAKLTRPVAVARELSTTKLLKHHHHSGL